MLSISPDYFRLRRPLKRRLYKLARKHCSSQERWAIGIEALQTKIGTKTPRKKLAFNLRGIEQTNHIPHYHIVTDKGKVTFLNRKRLVYANDHNHPMLNSNTYAKAKRAAPGYDVYIWKTNVTNFG